MSWAGDIAEAIIKQTSSRSNTDQQLLIGKIVALNPLSIKMYDQVVNKYVYADPAFTAVTSSEIDAAFIGADDIPVSVISLLKKALKQPLLKIGDTVIVWQHGTSFYILAKVV